MSTMTYRDDREALHHRVAQLEQELEIARRDGEQHGRDEAQQRTAALEQRLADMRGELEKMGAELQAMRGGRPPGAPNRALFIAVPIAVSLVLMGGVSYFFMVRTGASAAVPAQPVAQPPEPATVAPPVAVAPVPAAPIPLEPITPPSTPRSTTARWAASVTRAEGLPIAAGSSCTIEAILATNHTNAIVRELTVFCGATKLYRSKDSLNGMAQMSNDAREKLGSADDKSSFTMSYRDIGSRTGERTQIDLDTPTRQGAVFRETIPRFRVELSVPVASAATAALAGPDQRLRRAGKVVDLSGVPALKSGAACVLRAMPNGKGNDCVAEIACGTTVLWPSTTPVKCTYEAGRPATVTADQGPAILALDGATLTVKNKAVSATIALDEP